MVVRMRLPTLIIQIHRGKIPVIAVCAEVCLSACAIERKSRKHVIICGLETWPLAGKKVNIDVPITNFNAQVLVALMFKKAEMRKKDRRN